MLVKRGLPRGLALRCPRGAGGGETLFSLGVNRRRPPLQEVLGSHIADGAVQSNFVVVLHKRGDDPTGFFQRERRPRADRLRFQRFMPPLDLPVALGIIRRSAHMRHPRQANILLEVPRDELRAVITDDARRDARILGPRALDNPFDLHLGHALPNLPMHDEATSPVEHTAQVVERAADVQIRDIDMPVCVRTKRLLEPRAFLRGTAGGAFQHPGIPQDTVHAGRTHRHKVAVNHHVSQATIAFQRILLPEIEDFALLLAGEPVITRNPAIVFIHLSVAVPPGMVFALAYAQPVDQARGREFRFVAPDADEIDDGVACLQGNPGAGQSSPSSFFSAICSSINSESTSCLRVSFASSSATRRSVARAAGCGLSLPNAAAPFSKNCFCHW